MATHRHSHPITISRHLNTPSSQARRAAKLDLAFAGDGRAFAEETLRRTVQQGLFTLDELVSCARTWPPTNQVVIANVVIDLSSEGAGSSLLDLMLRWPCAEAAQRSIWRARLGQSGISATGH